jgi:hypothetical protein
MLAPTRLPCCPTAVAATSDEQRGRRLLRRDRAAVTDPLGGYVVRCPEPERRRGDLDACAAHEAAGRTRPQPGARRGRSAGARGQVRGICLHGRRLRAGGDILAAAHSDADPVTGPSSRSGGRGPRGRRSPPWRLLTSRDLARRGSYDPASHPSLPAVTVRRAVDQRRRVGVSERGPARLGERPTMRDRRCRTARRRPSARAGPPPEASPAASRTSGVSVHALLTSAAGGSY